MRALIPWEVQRRMDEVAPDAWSAPTGTRCVIDYAADGGPRIEVRVQELFGLSAHPAVAGGRVPLTLSLLSPARRPIQTTKDLPGFWRGSWAEVRKEMRGRYPKHPWPEDPEAAVRDDAGEAAYLSTKFCVIPAGGPLTGRRAGTQGDRTAEPTGSRLSASLRPG